MPAGDQQQDAAGGVDPGLVERIKALCLELRPDTPSWDEQRGVPRSVFERFGAIGAWEARWPRREPGAGNVAVMAEIARATAQMSYGAAVAMGIGMESFFRALARCEWGEEAWDDAIAGRRVGAFAVSERSGGSNPTHCETLAERDGDGWVLSGHKHYVSNALAATDFVAFTRTNRGKRDLSNFTLFVVPFDAPGVTATPHDLMLSPATSTYMVDLDGVHVGPERVVGRPGSGLVTLLELLRAERLAAGVGGIALAELCFEIAFAYAQRRDVAGGKLRHQQAIAHRLAEFSCEIAAARALVDQRLAAAQAGKLSSADASQVKFMSQRLAHRMADGALQILGARGYTEETSVARIWRESRLGRLGGGTDEIQLEIIAQALRPGALADHPAVVAAGEAAEEQ